LVSRHNKYERESEVSGKGKDRREVMLSRKISEKKEHRAFREKIMPQRESKQPKEQLKLQSKETNPRFSKESHSNSHHPLVKKQPNADSKSKDKSIDLK
jgi:hypothetical protein